MPSSISCAGRPIRFMPRISLLRDPQSPARGARPPRHRHRQFRRAASRPSRRRSTRRSRLRVALSRPSAILTFEPHPRDFFRKDEPVFRLTPLPEKSVIARASGPRCVHRVRPSMPRWRRCRPRPSSRNGSSRASTSRPWSSAPISTSARGASGPRRCSSERGGGFPSMSRSCPRSRTRTPGASRRARCARALAEGDIAHATELLGHRWFVTGEVLHGEKRGRELGFPTANLRLDASCRLRHGIYAVRALVDGRVHEGRRELRPTTDLRQWRAAARGVRLRFRRRSLREDAECGVRGLDPRRGKVRKRRGADRKDARDAARGEGRACAQARAGTKALRSSKGRSRDARDGHRAACASAWPRAR